VLGIKNDDDDDDDDDGGGGGGCAGMPVPIPSAAGHYVGCACVAQVTPNDDVRDMVATGANALPNQVVQSAFKVGCNVQDTLYTGLIHDRNCSVTYLCCAWQATPISI
jgi:hypothetical protein